jgi:uncharacterized protein YcfJ
MLITKKMLLALTLVGALAGGGIGALITHSSENTRAANDNYQTSQPATSTANTPEQQEAARESQFSTSQEQTAYKQGFDEGFNSCVSARNNGTSNMATNSYATYRTPVRRYSNGSRRVYYDYNNQPRGRSFWQKHRDKLTLAMGTGGGALLGGLIGGKKGAGIGALVGAGGSALYTYKLRKRTRRY